ncbi:MAG: hypothetical protein A2W91_01045 [Bacteroidetes bacterium GWF2_38_335]|nr:MAG: hypothetical protein A2W91_01045 [Bacteroidetes bacterium GWF2_38_335]OFY80340.1 MAG: hypothetical protein A2281_17555 [Bacteroidetes bacterium RIFOXYA12_FULL_38_20]HBS88859.1 hypothetical protein [Bacteroidales bacterium]
MRLLLLNILVLGAFYLLSAQKGSDDKRISGIAEKIDFYISMADASLNEEPEKTYKYANKALMLAKNMGLNKQHAEALQMLGRYYDLSGKYHKALEKYKLAEKIIIDFSITEKISSISNDIAISYESLGDYNESLVYYFRALNSVEKSDYRYSHILSNIAGVYTILKEYDLAAEYYEFALEEAKKTKDKRRISIALNNIGMISNLMGFNNVALLYFKDAIKTARESKDLAQISSVLANMGMAYLNIEDFQKAEECFVECLDIDSSRNYRGGIAYDYMNLGKLEYLKKNYSKALYFFDKSLKIAIDINTKSLQQENYDFLSRTYSKQNDFKKAYDYHILYSAINDTIISAEKNRKIAELQVSYDFKQKDNELQQLNEKEEYSREVITKQRQFIHLVFGASIVLLLVIVLFVWQYFQKKRTNRKLSEQNNQIEKQHEELNTQNEKLSVLYEELKEYNKNITDSIVYSKRIQKAILPNQERFQRIFPESFVFYKPKDIVSGDFYWVEETEDKILLAAVDCTGHGVPGAIMSALCFSVLNHILKTSYNNLEPDEILRRAHFSLNNVLNQEYGNSNYSDSMDIALCVIIPSENRLLFSGANRPLFYIHQEELFVVNGNKLSVGGKADLFNGDYETREIKYKNGDLIYLFSDGYADQFGGLNHIERSGGGKKFTTGRFKEFILKNHNNDMNIQKEIFIHTFENWKGDNEQVDDVLVLGIRL